MLKQRRILVIHPSYPAFALKPCQGLLIGRKLSTFESTRSPEVNDFRWTVKNEDTSCFLSQKASRALSYLQFSRQDALLRSKAQSLLSSLGLIMVDNLTVEQIGEYPYV